MPITREGSGLRFHSLSQWQFNAATGQWRVGPENNYILNPDFQAGRIIVPELTGWTNYVDSGPDMVTNVEGGANSSRFDRYHPSLGRGRRPIPRRRRPLTRPADGVADSQPPSALLTA
jgi:hypothetical protein